jgi:prolyl-tRNA editing enzyme YbaK/EbsC (Cys-tRNA(Pro) deacylase)
MNSLFRVFALKDEPKARQLLLSGSNVKRWSKWVSQTNSGVPPFGHSTQLRVFVDPDLLQYDEVWAAAGTWNDNFGAAPADIVRVAGGVVTDLKRA